MKQILNWIVEKQVRTHKGQDIEFNDHYFLLEYLQDDAQRIVVQKPAQVGATFSTILKILYLADEDAISVIYTMPTALEARDLVVSKFDPVIEKSPGLRINVHNEAFKKQPIWSTVLKRIGDSYFFFKSSWVSWKAQQIDADVLVVDELDFQKPEVRAMYEERLEGSKSKDIIYWIGYPSIPNYGISELYQKSDQREWWITCPWCKKEQTLEWPDSISRQKKTYVCKFCRKDLSDLDRKRGVWKPKFPGRKIHGYAINRLMAPWIPATRILQSFMDDTPRHFYNYTLGLPYQDAKEELTDEMIRNATIGDELWQTLKSEYTICGIDQGDQFHLISGVVTPAGPVVTNAELIREIEDLEKTLDNLKPDMVVMDGRPDRHIAKLLQAKYGISRFFLANERDWGEATSSIKGHFEVKRGTGIVNMERTECLDNMFNAIREASLKFKNNIPYFNVVIKHLKSLTPDYADRYGTVRKVWKNVGQDHYAHALLFFYTAYEILCPSQELLQSELIPSTFTPDFIPGTPEWIDQDFEKMITKLANPSGTIIIPPKFRKK